MIYVAPLDNAVPPKVPQISERLRETFETEVVTYRPPVDLNLALDKERQQYNSTVLLARLLESLPSPDARMVGITSVDLYIPVLTFVFGEAQLNGRVAVASSYRLRETFYGLPDNADLTMERLEKEVIHELGHVYGLIHCATPECVMHASSGVEELDLKTRSFCSACSGVLGGRTSTGRS